MLLQLLEPAGIHHRLAVVADEAAARVEETVLAPGTVAAFAAAASSDEWPESIA